MSHEDKQGESSMYTNPALPVTVGAGDFHDRHHGFEPADAALVQSNNLSNIQNQIAFGQHMLNESVSRNSKENALLVKDNQIAMERLVASNQLAIAGIGPQVAAAVAAAAANSETNRLLERLINKIEKLTPTT